MKKAYRAFIGLLSAVGLSVLSGSVCAQQILPEQLCWSAQPMVVSAAFSQPSNLAAVQTDTVPEEYVIPGGIPFGIKMFTDGVMIVGMTDILCDGHTVNPAKAAGLRPGDVITRIDGERVGSNEQVAAMIAGCQGEALTLTICREDASGQQITLQPVLGDEDAGYRAGMWVRDSSAGIGTMTYLDPENGTFAGLGHAVCDIDTGDLMPLSSGEAVNVTITGVTKGESGHPGELRGAFSDGAPIGILTRNDITGIYGRLNGAAQVISQCGEPLPIASRQEIKTGKAYIRATIDAGGPKEYEITIERIDQNEDNPTRNMMIRITDPKLIAATGGIVQGMSGSPIIQDGKLIGAVTHVLVNDPTRGYGIFIENMLETAN